MYKYSITTALLFFISINLFSQNNSVMSYNIRLDVASDGENRWSLRKDYLLDQIRFYSPDVFGIQEGLPSQTKYINDNLKTYDFIGDARDGVDEGEYSAIFYNTTKYSVENAATFWLSETPDEISRGWDAACNRVCTYGLFTNLQTKEKFWVFNTHLDHVGEKARKSGVALIIKRIAEITKGKHPSILMGDFNATSDSEPIQIILSDLNDSKKVSNGVVFGPDGTYNGFKFDKPVTNRIDYIFVSKTGIEVLKYAVLSDSNNLKYPSDHLPVYIEFLIKN